ncbi:metalloregulator ArsR/SmtB family transcription factor [Nocardia salmonicida]|uniref:ArsR/SmtB family transcription factor n=1 Tax=Nocardia TaxID=1817 RepID=UPI00265A7158|nr:metalloregulator ArsR/SmtB family transcription factor [Nocardia sp. PE-7]WKG07279.1 metalloregulator ArsR/SmtB family transcription factor [Nocardia sp. PE-7]
MDVFEALADPVRRDLLERLAGAPARVVDLASEYPISRPAISKHLRILADAGLVHAEQHGRERHYRLAPAGLAPLHHYLAQLQRTRPPIPEHALDGLDLEVRRTTRERRGTTSTDKEQTA